MGKLDDLLVALPTQKISIEFKEKNWTTIKNAMDKLKGQESRIRITSRNVFVSSKIRVHYPEFSTEQAQPEHFLSFFQYLGFYLPFSKPEFETLCVRFQSEETMKHR